MREIEAYDTLSHMLEGMDDPPPIIYDNNEIPARPPFLIVDLIPEAKRVVGLKWQTVTQGSIQVTVVTLGGGGLGLSEEIALRVAECFPAGAQRDGVEITSPPELVGGYPDNGLWRNPIRIRWKVLPGY